MAGCIDKLEEIPVDVFGGENRTPEFLAKNPAGTVPALVLADGSIMGETLAICEYLDEVFGPSDVVGKTPEARLETRMCEYLLTTAV
jgi:glutathione S-transferase